MPEDNLKNLAIESELPLKAVGIENLKEDNPKHMPPHRYLHPWFARRPTPVSRLAVLASLLPDEVSNDEMLKLMQVGPKRQFEGSLEDYVERKKASESERSGTLGEHYGYPRIYTSTPDKEERESLREMLEDHWGQKPTIIDPTAGGGVIPLESLRYGIDTKANELNPVPSLILKAMLDYSISVESLEDEINKWAEKIDERASEKLKEYFPSDDKNREPSHYACTYSIECPDCGKKIPLNTSWWLFKKSSTEGVAVRPEFEDGELNYKKVKLPEDVEKTEFNPQKGPKSRGGAKCINCGVIADGSEIKRSFQEDNAEFEVLGAKTVGKGSSEYRAANDDDREALKKAEKKINQSPDLSTFLDFDIPEGKETARTRRHGIEKWRQLFNPRQLISHYEYMSAFNHFKHNIRTEYSEEKAEAILTILSFPASKMIDRNSRMAPYSIKRGYPANAFGGKNYSFQWLYVDNNPAYGDQKYLDMVERIKNSYEEIVNYVEEVETDSAEVFNEDAADLPLDKSSVQGVIVDPPYYSSVMYAELADLFYVWLEKYLEDTHPNFFETTLTDKDEEAVANTSKFEEVADAENSKKELARDDYEKKMTDIFDEMYRILEPGGVMTVMFTHKETDAWDTLTKSLINSGFTVTATHPVTSEMPDRIDTRGGGSADTTLLLTGRKPKNPTENKEPSLWKDVEEETKKVARESAEKLINSSLNLTKTDIIISAFGPTLKVFSQNYPVVDSYSDEISPKKALETARKSVVEVLIEENLSETNLESLDSMTRWYLLSWLVHESSRIHYDDARQLGMGVGVDIDEIKRKTKVWSKKGDEIQLSQSKDRVKSVNKKEKDRSSRKPIKPEAISFSADLNKVHAALHIYRNEGDRAALNWLQERNLGSDKEFKLTLKTLLETMSRDQQDWETARDLTVGKTGEYLDIEVTKSMISRNSEEERQTKFEEHIE